MATAITALTLASPARPAETRAADLRCCCMAAARVSGGASACPRFPAGRRTYREHVELDLGHTSLLKDQGRLEVVVLAEWLLQIDEHDVGAAGFKLDSLARLDLKTVLELSHLRDALLHGHLVDLKRSSDIRGAANEAISRRARVDDFEVAGADARALRSSARPGIGDRERARLILAGGRGHRGQADERRNQQSEASHGLIPS